MALAKLNTLHNCMFYLLIAFSLPVNTEKAVAGMGTSVAISAVLATSIADGLFPVTIHVNNTRLFLTDPTMLFVDDKRIGMQVRLQAYDHRPAQNIAVSELGRARISGELDYDPATRQALLYEPRIDKLEFDSDSEVTRGFFTEVTTAWSAQVTNPIRSELPPHPYLLPFKENIRDLSYDGKSINVEIFYE